MTPQTKNIFITSSILSVIVAILVLWNTPSHSESEKQGNKTLNLIKVLIISFGLCTLVLYIMQDNDDNAMMTNIIAGEPDF